MSDKYLRSEQQLLLNAIGTDLCWGWSPAIDFMELLPMRSLAQLVQPSTESRGQNPGDDDDDDDGEQSKNKKGDKGPAPPAEPATSHEDDGLDELDRLLLDTQKKKTSSTATGAEDGSVGADEEVKILLCGACDIRHVFRTLASLRVLLSRQSAGQRATLHFYIYEPNLRVQSRQLFFLQWLVDSLFSLTELEDRVAMFLEVFGNSLLRDITSTQAKLVAKHALRSIGFAEGALGKAIDFSSEMKSKEKDFVEEQIKHWVKESSRCAVQENWISRVRMDMAERYDNRDNLVDWDFNFHLFEYTNAMKFPEYRKWRSSGIAFDYCHINPRKGFNYDYTQPNHTLCHYDRKGVGIYNGDIKNGPFYSIGIDGQNEFLKARQADGTLKFGNGVQAMHNVRAWLYSLMTGREWPWEDHKFAWDDPANYNYLPPGTPSDVEYQASMPKAKFTFIGLDLERTLSHFSNSGGGAGGGRKARGFDAAFVGSNSSQFMTPAFFSAMSADGVVVAETIKFVIDAKDDAKAAFEEKLKNFAQQSHWAVDDAGTAKLHRFQPPPRKFETELSEAQKKSAARLKSNYQLVFKHSPLEAAAAS